MRNKKIIALVCALSMLFSMFASFTVVRADGEAKEGIVLKSKTVSTTVTEITVEYGEDFYTEGVAAADVFLDLPANAKVTYTKPLQSFTYLDEVLSSGVWKLTMYTAGPTTKVDDHVIAVITVTLPESLAKPYTITLQKGSSIANDTISYLYTDTQQDLVPTTAVIEADPDKEVETPLDPPTYDENVEQPKPYEPVEPDETKGGIALETVKVSDDEYNIVVTYVGEGFIQEGVAAADIFLDLPTDAEITYTKPLQGFTYLDEVLSSGIWKLTMYTAGATTKVDDHILTTITVKYPAEGYASDHIVTLQKGSSIANDTLSYLYTDTQQDFAAVTTVLPANAAPKNTFELKDAINSDSAKQAQADDPNAYLAFSVTKKDGTEAVYGTDYVAYFNGTELTEDQLKALLAGKWKDEEGYTLEDVVKGLTFKYNNGVDIKVQLVAGGEVVDSGETDNKGDKEKNPVNGSIKASNPNRTVNVGDSVEMKFTVTPAKDTTGATIPHKEGVDKVSINVDEASYNVLSATGITVTETVLKDKDKPDTKDNRTTNKDRVKIDDADTDVDLTYSIDNTYTVSFTPLAKTPSKEPIEFTMTYTDGNGKPSSVTATVKVVEKKTGSTSSSSSGSGSDSDKSSSDVLANGNTGLLNGGLLGGTAFIDMADYGWAQEAVNALAAKNIVSGRGDGTFDPGGQVTRAEYAQMLINAIGKSGDYADTSFNDVPTDAWFYHNVAVAAQLGIVSGYGDGNFGPYDLITREQMALMTQKAAIVMNKSLSGTAVAAFTDDAEISDWAKTAVYDLANVGIINGMGDGTFAPKANATRAQAAVIIYSAFVK